MKPCPWFAAILLFVAPAYAADIWPPEVKRILDAHRIPTDRISAYVQPVDSDVPLLAIHATEGRHPASAIKLLTTYVALEQLGPAHTWTTQAYLQGTLSNGTLNGDLLLRGGGDPWLTTEHFWRMLRELRARGLKDIKGDLLIDDQYFSVPAEDPAAFDRQPFRAYNVAPSALTVNFKVARFLFRPGTGQPAVLVDVDPPLANLRVDNALQLRNGRCEGYQRGVKFDMPGGMESGVVRVEGRFPSGCSEFALWRTVLNHQQFAYGAFAGLWREMGGTLQGRLGAAAAPASGAAFYTHRSPPLAEVIRNVNKYSNNVMTRILLLTMGAESGSPPGTVENGRKAVSDWLAGEGLNLPELHLANGSGLSRDTRVSAAGMGRLLHHAWSSRYRAELIASLPISGVDGTLRRRFRDAGARGRMHLKTGRLDDVVAIAGFVYADSGQHYVVVAMDNAPGAHRGPGKEWQEALLQWVLRQ